MYHTFFWNKLVKNLCPYGVYILVEDTNKIKKLITVLLCTVSIYICIHVYVHTHIHAPLRSLSRENPLPGMSTAGSTSCGIPVRPLSTWASPATERSEGPRLSPTLCGTSPCGPCWPGGDDLCWSLRIRPHAPPSSLLSQTSDLHYNLKIFPAYSCFLSLLSSMGSFPNNLSRLMSSKWGVWGVNTGECVTL